MKRFCTIALVLTLTSGLANAREPDGIFPEIRGTFDPQALAPLLEKATLVIIHEEPGTPTFLTGLVLIHAPFEKVWSVVTAYEKYSEFVPNVIHIHVLERRPESRSQDSEYKTGFKAGPIELGIVWTLEQHLEKDEYTIWSRPSKRGEQAFTEVNYREIYFPVDENRTIMAYTNYANLASFGALAKLVFKTFPELQTPTLVSVGTLFPEAIKERVESSKVIIEPKGFDRERVSVPPPIANGTALEGLLRRFRKVILSWYPDSNGIRFFSALALVDASPARCKAVVTDFARYPTVFRPVESARRIKGDERRFTVEFNTKFKIAVPLNFNYSLDYEWSTDGNRLLLTLNRIRDHSIEGEWGAWDFFAMEGETLLSYTSFTDLRSGGLFLRLLMDHIAGFGTGFRVGMNSMLIQAFSSAVAADRSPAVSGTAF